MWLLEDPRRQLARALAEAYRQKLGAAQKLVGVDPKTLLADDYILGYIMGQTMVMITHQIGRQSGPDYAAIMLDFFEGITDGATAKAALARMSANCTGTSPEDFLRGNERGSNMAFLFIGKRDREDDPEIIEARANAPALSGVLQPQPGQAAAEDRLAATYLDQKYFARYIEAKYKKPPGPA